MYLPYPAPTDFDSLSDLCRKRLALLFPTGIPKLVEDRLQAELGRVSSVHAEDEFLLFYQLSLAAHASGNTIQTTSTRVAGSFLEYLLGNGLENPLPAYYYCTKCGHFELGNTVFGIDSPEKCCPHCDTKLLRDGFSIPIEPLFGPGTGFYPQLHYEISDTFFPIAYQTADTFYQQLNLQTVPLFFSGNSQPYMGGFAGLRSNKLARTRTIFPGYPDGIDCTVPNSEEDLITSNSQYAFVYNSLYPDFSSTSLQTLCTASPKDIVDTVWDSCLDKTEEQCISDCNPSSFLEIAQAFCSAKVKCEEKDSLFKYRIFSFEDLFEVLQILGIDKKSARRYAEIVRKGRAFVRENEIKDLSLPHDLEELLLNIRHLPFRIFGVRRLIAFMRMNHLEESRLPLRKSPIRKDAANEI